MSGDDYKSFEDISITVFLPPGAQGWRPAGKGLDLVQGLKDLHRVPEAIIVSEANILVLLLVWSRFKKCAHP